jgi:hypothetical protein
MSGWPQADAFNAFIFRTLKLDKWRMGDKSLFRYGDDVGEMKLYARRFYSVSRFDGRLVSLWTATADYVGGHDEERGGAALNWDVRKGAGFRWATSSSRAMIGKNLWPAFALPICARNSKRMKKTQISVSRM